EGRTMKTLATKARGHRRSALLATLVGSAALLGLAGPAAALGAPVLNVNSSHVTAKVPVGYPVKYTLAVTNTGDAVASGPITVKFAVPAGLTIKSASAPKLGGFLPTWSCSTPTAELAECTGPTPGFGWEPGPGQEACNSLSEIGFC